MVGVESVRKFKVLFEKAKEKVGEENAKKLASVVIFNGDYGYFEINGKFYYAKDTNFREVELSEEPDLYYKLDGDGFLVIEDGEVSGFTMPQEEVTLIDYSLINFGLSLRFRYEFINGKAVIRFMEAKPHLNGTLVFYNTISGWRLGKIDGFTTMEGDDYIIVGIPVINGKEVIAPIVPVTAMGYPNDEFAVISLLKSDLEKLKAEYQTKENLKELAEMDGYTIVMFERMLSYRDELLLWDIAESIIGSKEPNVINEFTLTTPGVGVE